VVLKRILLVEDEIPVAENLKSLLELEGYTVDTAESFKKAKEKLNKYNYHIVILDLFLPDGNGMELLPYINLKQSKVIVLTAHGTIDLAIKAVKQGAYDFLQKPITYKKLLSVIKKALKESNLISTDSDLEAIELIGESKFIKELKKTLPELAKKETNILIRGEEGTGKTYIGKIIHKLSSRSEFPVETVIVSNKSTFELEKLFFGSKIPGKESEGLLEKTLRGTLIIRRLENMDFKFQKVLNEVMEKGYFYPLGSSERKALNTRFISTTSQNLYKMTSEKLFYENLLIKLNGEELEVPPLRERREDIVPLFEFFINKFSEEHGLEKPILTDSVYNFLYEYNFPGNISELKNIAERLVLLYHGKPVKVEDLHIKSTEQKNELFSIQNWKQAKKQFEKEFLKRKLIETGGDIKTVAKLINLDLSNVYRKIKEYGLENYVSRKSE
jgi:two-component system nitrogen regulation response regulator NtrX